MNSAGFGLAAAGVLLMLVWSRHGSRALVLGHSPIQRKPVLKAASAPRNRPKPRWVIQAVLRLRALAPNLWCRENAEVFNRRHGAEGMTVSRTWVSLALRRHRAQLLRLRRELKHRVPRPMPRDALHGLDLTGKVDLTGKQRIVLGLLDHGTRACLALRELADKSSLSILRELVLAFRRFGVPKAIRTDNEACFTSKTLRWGLRLLGIQHQTTELGCPWQNG